MQTISGSGTITLELDITNVPLEETTRVHLISYSGIFEGNFDIVLTGTPQGYTLACLDAQVSFPFPISMNTFVRLPFHLIPKISDSNGMGDALFDWSSCVTVDPSNATLLSRLSLLFLAI